MKNKKINFLIIGCGSIGQRHLKNLLSLGQKNIKIYDANTELARNTSKKFRVEAITNLEFENIDCVLICTPPSTHIKLATQAAIMNTNIFIEKPLSDSLRHINEISALVKKKKLNIFIGYTFRFDKGLQKIEKIIHKGEIGKIISFDAYEGWYLPKWRSWQDHTKSYTGSKKLGGGIILDGSHELNYIQWLLGDIKEVFSYYKKIPSLNVQTEGLAEIILRSKSNVIGRIHLDFINPRYNRHCEIIGEKGSIRWSFEKKTIEMQKSNLSTFKVIKYGRDTNQMYKDEMKYLINCILGNNRNEIITLKDAIKTLKVTLAIKESGKLNRPVSV